MTKQYSYKSYTAHILFIVFLLCSLFQFCESKQDDGCCSHPTLSYFCPHCYANCVLRKDPVAKLRELLNTKYFGQKHVMEEIIEMFETHLQSNRLTSFHIAGDNGVGKSYMIKLFAEALYEYYPAKSGLLILSGTNYQGDDPVLVEQHKSSIFNITFQQLLYCPNSLIVIDDVQYVHSTTLLVLQQFMDIYDFVVTKDGIRVKKNRAMLGLVSDFGIEGRTRDKTLEELEQVVMEHTQELWNMDPKQTQLIQYTIPFVSLSDEEIEAILRYEVEVKLVASERFKSLVWNIHTSEETLQWMRFHVRKKYPFENGRGAEKWISKVLIPWMGRELNRATIETYPVHVEISYQDNDLKFDFTTSSTHKKDEL